MCCLRSTNILTVTHIERNSGALKLVSLVKFCTADVNHMINYDVYSGGALLQVRWSTTRWSFASTLCIKI